MAVVGLGAKDSLSRPWLDRPDHCGNNGPMSGRNSDKIRQVIDYIGTVIDPDGTWVLPTDVIREIFEVDRADYLRVLYTLPNSEMSEILDSISDVHATALIELLEALTDPVTPGRLLDRAGIFLSQTSRRDIQELVVETALDIGVRMEVDYRKFRAMCREGRAVDRAVELYILDHFDIDQVAHETVELFVAKQGFLLPTAAAREADRIIRLLVTRHVLERETLASPLRNRLYRFAETEFFEERNSYAQNKDDWADGYHRAGLPPDVVDAMKVFGLHDISVGRKHLRKRYRELMKTFHPDVNVLGLKQAQKITRSYAILSSFL